MPSGLSICWRALDPGAISAGSWTIPSRGFASKPFAWPKTRLKREPALLAKLLALADDPDPMVRFQLAFSLGEASDDPRAIAALAAIAAQDAGSAWTRTAVLSSIAGRSLALFDALGQRAGFLDEPSRPGLARRAGVPGGIGARPGPGSRAARAS